MSSRPVRQGRGFQPSYCSLDTLSATPLVEGKRVHVGRGCLERGECKADVQIGKARFTLRTLPPPSSINMPLQSCQIQCRVHRSSHRQVAHGHLACTAIGKVMALLQSGLGWAAMLSRWISRHVRLYAPILFGRPISIHTKTKATVCGTRSGTIGRL